MSEEVEERVQVKSLAQIPFNATAFATAHIAVLETDSMSVRAMYHRTNQELACLQNAQAHQKSQCYFSPRIDLRPINDEDWDTRADEIGKGVKTCNEEEDS